MKCTKVFNQTLEAFLDDDIRIISNVGSTRSSKTFSTLQLLYLIALKRKVYISIVSCNIPHLKRGCLKDFEIIINSENRAGIVDINKSDRKYIFASGSTIEFFSADNSGKLRGSQRDILFINECNLIPAECYRQLAIRTSSKIFLDYNPTNEFWIEDIRDRKDFIEFHSTYKDNDFLSTDQIREIESNKNNESWWRVYGLGLQGSNEGLIYPRFEYTNKIPDGKVIWGMDFGYNDPTALVKVTIVHDNIYLEEKLYKVKLSAEDIYEHVKGIVPPNDLIICDNARPEIISYLRKKGIRAVPCNKGKNSIKDGIAFLNSFNIFIKGLHIHREIKNYSYLKDELRDKWLDIPEDANNHALDAARYAATYNQSHSSGYNIKFS